MNDGLLKLGIIGLSEKNGHPYSWAAIVNGQYNEKEMAKCGYDVIVQYLALNKEKLGIPRANVTHIWTQNRSTSEHIAAASHIGHVVDNIEQLIDEVDAVILARDDAENHVAMAKPFLDAGVPIFIDKPLARYHADLDYFTQQHAAGRFFMSCSSMRYSPEIIQAKKDLSQLGEVELLTAVGKKDWLKYGVHMLEAAMSLLDDPPIVSARHLGQADKNVVYLELENGLVATFHLFHNIVPTFQVSAFGNQGWQIIEMNDTFGMFHNNMLEFVESVRQGKVRLDFKKTHNIIRALIAAQENLENRGETIYLDKEDSRYLRIDKQTIQEIAGTPKRRQTIPED